VVIVAGIAVVLLITVFLTRLEPAAPTVAAETLLIDQVKRGPMLRQVRGPGTLVPVDVRWISAPVDGRVERIPALPGVTVKEDTILLEMTDPTVEQNVVDAESQLKAAEADYDNLKAKLESDLLAQKASVTTAQSASDQAKLQLEADERLSKDGLIPELNYRLSRLKHDQLFKQAQTEVDRYQQSKRSSDAQLAAQRARVEQFRGTYELKRRQMESLKVRAGINGVLQELPVQVGQRVTPGTVLAKVARPESLKAELKVPEVQAKDVLPGQLASIDTRNGVMPGHVLRVAPSAVDGTVIVDVTLEGDLPKGARPDISVDGTIEIERLDNVLYVGRPAYGSANSKIEMFKLIENGKRAVRVPVELGRVSVNTVEVVKGLQAGDKVILSDTSAQDGYNKIRLN
jgi:HlyD family secretion protein